MKWVLASSAIFNDNADCCQWMVDVIPNQRHHVQLLPRSKPLENFHDRKEKYTPIREWLNCWEQASDTLAADSDGIITTFPQLPATIGLQEHLFRIKKPIVALDFSIGRLHSGIRQSLARVSLSHVDRFSVFNRHERELYSQWLNLPIERFVFLPQPMEEPELRYIQHAENTEQPYVTALGSAYRDFSTLFKSVEKLNLRAVVATGKRALEGTDVPFNVETPFGISRSECFQLIQQARINVISLKPQKDVTAAGVRAITESMFIGCPTIATQCFGTEDYIIHGETGWLVEPNSVDKMIEAIETLWHDEGLRKRLGQAAKKYAEENFTREVRGAAVARILDDVAGLST